jgi:hypothetical protein
VDLAELVALGEVADPSDGSRFARDSPLEGDGFEPSVPRNRERTSGAKSDLEDSRRRRIRQAE